MALTPIKALLFLAGGAAAAGGVAYVSGVLDPYLGGEAPKLAAAPVPETTEAPATGKSQAEPKAARLPQPPGAKSPVAGDAPSGEAPAAQDVLPPSFDVVRVEGDGSIVIAGKAAAGATVEIVTGARVIGNAIAGPDGDFAVVIDEPLKPGGYQIVLRSTAPDNVVATSLETAVVSIPEQPDGQVLALVEKPGEPSKLITVPEPEPAPPLKAAPEGAASGEAVPPGDAPAANAPDASASADAPAAAPATDQSTAQSEPAAPTSESAPAEQLQAEAKPDPAPVELAPSAPSGEPQVAVEAVEIEGRKVFVAGLADAGRKVRIYANDILLGEAEASPGGRFLIETERDLPVGDYIIRADALEPDNVKVAARAAVPFEREAGENLAAVAPSGNAVASQPDASAAAPKPAEPAPAITAEEASPPSTQPAGQPAGQAGSSTAAPEEAPAASSTASEPASSAEPAKPATGAVIAAAPEATPLAPKLESASGAVIIRRGDSLWRISRRVYGKGIRYSTIYLANQEQISNPHRIWPGQVFKVPEKTDEGEEADMKAVGEQATTTTTQ